MNDNINMTPKAHKGILGDLFEQRNALLREYAVACSAPVKDNQLIDTLHHEIDKKTIEIDMLLRKYNYDPVMPRFEPEPPGFEPEPTTPSTQTPSTQPPSTQSSTLRQRAQQLAQLPEVKAAFASEVLAMTDGRWLRLVELLSPGGELAMRIEGKPKQKNTYLLVQALCDEGWIAGGLTPSHADELGKALSYLTASDSELSGGHNNLQAKAHELAQRITKGKSSFWVKYDISNLPPIKDWDKYGMLSDKGKLTARYMQQKLRNP